MDIFQTQDGYHIEDILANGRCTICGHIAHNPSVKDSQGKPHLVCSETECRQHLRRALHSLAD